MKRKIISTIIICALLTSCSTKDDSENSQTSDGVTPFSQAPTAEDTIDTEGTSESTFSYTDIDAGVEISYADDMFVSGAEITNINVYQAHYAVTPDLISSHIKPPYDYLPEFNWKSYFGQEYFNADMESVTPPLEMVYQTVSSVDSCDNGDLTFAFPSSDYQDEFVLYVGNQNLSFYVHNELIDGVPVCGKFEANVSDVYCWPGLINSSIFFPHDSILISDDNRIMLSSAGEFSDLTILEESVPVVSQGSIDEAIEQYINHTANHNCMDSAYVWGKRLMYIPLVEFSIEQNNHVGYEYVDYQNIDANVYLLPVWTVYYIAEYHESNELFTCYINAITGEPLYSEEYSVGDPSFLIGGF